MKKTIRVLWNGNFKKVNECKHRYRVLMGGAGSGKSVNVAQDFIKKLSCKKYKGANLLVLRKALETNRDSTFAELNAAIERMFGEDKHKFFIIKTSPLYIESKITNSAIIFRGMKDEFQREKVKSITFKKGKLTWIWMEEATEFLEADLDILDDRLRGELQNPNLYYQITLTFNPVSASHWIKKRFFDKPSDNVFLHHSTYLQNRFLDEDFHKRMMERKERDPEGYRVYGLGEWGESGGLIFTNWKAAEFDTDLSRFDALFMGQDFGFNHANAIILVGIKDGDIYVLDEVYLKNYDTNEIIKYCEGKLPKNVYMFCDSAEPDRIRMWQKAGYKAVSCPKGPGSVKAQIDFLKSKRIFIHPKCTNTIREISMYRWMKDARTNTYLDEPMCIDDDLMAALRYSVEYLRKAEVLKR